MTENIDTPLTAKQIRQAEVDAYQKNIDTYTTLLATLDGEWDEDLLHLKDLDPLEAARQCPLDRVSRLAVLLHHKQISFLLKTEIIEHSKAKSILDIL